MSKKDWLYGILGAVVGGASIVFAKWAYKRLKSGRWDWWLEKQEKKNLIEAVEEFLRDAEKER